MPTPVEPAIGPENVRNAVVDPVPCLELARNGQTVHTHRIRLAPGAGGVNDSPRQRPVPSSGSVLPDDGEGRRLTPRGAHLVEPCPRNRRHRRALDQMPCDGRMGGQRLEVVLHQLVAGRKAARVRFRPPRLPKKLSGGSVYVELPRGEHLHVPQREGTRRRARPSRERAAPALARQAVPRRPCPLARRRSPPPGSFKPDCMSVSPWVLLRSSQNYRNYRQRIRRQEDASSVSRASSHSPSAQHSSIR